MKLADYLPPEATDALTAVVAEAEPARAAALRLLARRFGLSLAEANALYRNSSRKTRARWKRAAGKTAGPGGAPS